MRFSPAGAWRLRHLPGNLSRNAGSTQTPLRRALPVSSPTIERVTGFV